MSNTIKLKYSISQLCLYCLILVQVHKIYIANLHTRTSTVRTYDMDLSCIYSYLVRKVYSYKSFQYLIFIRQSIHA